MRPTLSLIVRRALLLEEVSADEAVLVHPSQLRMSDPDVPVVGTSSHASDGQGPREKATRDAKKAHAYVNTDRWRDAVVRTYSFLDQHKNVRDVVVQPIAADGAIDARIFSQFGAVGTGSPYDDDERGRARVQVMDRDAAREIMSKVDVDLPDARPSSITFIPVVGSGVTVRSEPGTLPSAWMTVHALFDSNLEMLPSCKRIFNKISDIVYPHNRDMDQPGLFGAVSALPLLLNCGWSENAFNMAIAAHRAGGKDFHRVLAQDMVTPPVGRRHRDPESVPLQPGKGAGTLFTSGLMYVSRPEVDVVAEIMTIAATKPAGVQPVLDRLSDMPDEFFIPVIKKTYSDASTRHLFDDVLSEDEVETLQAPLSISVRRRAVGHVLVDLKSIVRLAQNLRDLLVKDLVGKAVFVSVS